MIRFFSTPKSLRFRNGSIGWSELKIISILIEGRSNISFLDVQREHRLPDIHGMSTTTLLLTRA